MSALTLSSFCFSKEALSSMGQTNGTEVEQELAEFQASNEVY